MTSVLLRRVPGLFGLFVDLPSLNRAGVRFAALLAFPPQ